MDSSETDDSWSLQTVRVSTCYACYFFGAVFVSCFDAEEDESLQRFIICLWLEFIFCSSYFFSLMSTTLFLYFFFVCVFFL